MSCARILTAQLRGEDPTAGWREVFAGSARADYRRPLPPAMPAAFVLQLYLDVLATPAAYAAALGYVLDLSPAAVSFALAPVQAYPVAVQLRPGDLVTGESDLATRWERSRARYTTHAAAFAESYQPGVRMSSRQRLGMVEDIWVRGVLAASRALLAPPHPSPQRRQSCCFIYVLPGVPECVQCPRLT